MAFQLGDNAKPQAAAGRAESGTLFTVSAPSGAGKTSLVKALVEQNERLLVSVSHTTRAQRDNETDGVNYHFVSGDEFRSMAKANAFLESAEVFGNHYGTSKSWVETQLRAGLDVILEIDWQGAAQIRQWADGDGNQLCTSIFILPPSLDALKERLDDRGQDDSAVIAKRMSGAVEEMSHFRESDFLVINDDFSVALRELQVIIDSARLQTESQLQRHQQLLASLIG